MLTKGGVQHVRARMNEINNRISLTNYDEGYRRNAVAEVI